jgi:hypothetical protein
MRGAPRLKESDVQKQVRDFLKAYGWRPVRTQFAFVAGAMQTGEPGMPDYLFLRADPGPDAVYGCILGIWVEFKSPNSRSVCRCEPDRKCRLCRQAEWHTRERARGFKVWTGVDDFDWFHEQYKRHFGWLHTGDQARGQLELLEGERV